ncbi:uncharacterized protein LOC106083742 [Stomoxys calcitrans]|uniref:Uncharacterized protein n=1 Tax=Stomoxys calcitrans TaxID=35570 RepID=A0A1I8NY58_STOCA|nr:uncharacterized protein LOC106083742 [Stomoxys calcitrans]
MKLMPRRNCLSLAFMLFFVIITTSNAIPARLSDGIIDNLRTGYYYIDNGVITAVRRTDATPPPGRRRQDSATGSPSDLPHGVKFTPLVRYKQTKTKRKRLFVPNFFG